MNPIGLSPAEAFWLAAATSLLWNARLVMRWMVASFVVAGETEPEWFRRLRRRERR